LARILGSFQRSAAAAVPVMRLAMTGTAQGFILQKAISPTFDAAGYIRTAQEWADTIRP